MGSAQSSDSNNTSAKACAMLGCPCLGVVSGLRFVLQASQFVVEDESCVPSSIVPTVR